MGISNVSGENADPGFGAGGPGKPILASSALLGTALSSAQVG